VAKWFGPILQPCGCCYEEPPPPPPPPCQCADEDCFAEGEINWQTLKFEAEFADSLSFFTQYKNLICRPGCNRVYAVWETEWEWSGFSAFNGTYDIPFYAYDDYTEAWIEGDPTAIPCGVWFFPTITANLTLTRTNRIYSEPADVYSLYADSSCGQQVLTQTDTIPVNMETRSGYMWSSYSLPSFPSGFFMGPGISVSSFFPASTGSRTGSVFACTSAPLAAISQTLTDAPGWYLTSAIAPHFGWNAASGARFVGLKRSFGSEPSLRSSDYLWSQYPYGGPGIPISSTQCTLDIEEGEDDYTGFVTIQDGTFLAQCDPLDPTNGAYVPGVSPRQRWRVESSAWNQRFKLLANAP
jgi:hypothetical protein